MSLWTKIRNWGREKRDQAEEALTDHVRDGKFAIKDAKAERDKFRQTIIDLSKSIKLLEQQHADAVAEIKKWQGFAKKAAEAGNADDVKHAVTQEVHFKAQRDELSKQININTKQRDDLKAQLDGICNKIARAEQNYHVLAARQRGAEARKNLAQARAGLSDGTGLSALNDLENAVRDTECEAEAIEEMSGSDATDFEEKYGGSNTDVDDLVQKYMKK